MVFHSDLLEETARLSKFTQTRESSPDLQIAGTTRRLRRSSEQPSSSSLTNLESAQDNTQSQAQSKTTDDLGCIEIINAKNDGKKGSFFLIFCLTLDVTTRVNTFYGLYYHFSSHHVSVDPPLRALLLEQNELELCYARLTGVTYCLNHLPMLRRLWGSVDVVSEALRAICEAFKAPIARDALQSRLLSLTHGILNYREALNMDPNFQRHIVEVS